jgi:hypothetical protein
MQTMSISPEVWKQIRARVEASFARLSSTDARVREQGCAELGDFFEYDIGKGGHTRDEERRNAFGGEIRTAMRALIDLASVEQDSGVTETCLHALYKGVNYAGGEGAADWQKLAANLTRFTSPGDLYNALFCLASTGEAKYRPAIAAFLDHADPELRAAAAEPIAFIDHHIHIGAGRRAAAAGLSETEALVQGKTADVPFDPGCVLLGYYVKDSDMAERFGASWQTYRAALKRLNLTDHFTVPAPD